MNVSFFMPKIESAQKNSGVWKYIYCLKQKITVKNIKVEKQILKIYSLWWILSKSDILKSLPVTNTVYF